ncbi:MAG: hypothetical protein JO316_10495 [Abitibacteriaceae bacterium]|nr:hypothetical protein [Abditibacteriaceae bacterium]
MPGTTKLTVLDDNKAPVTAPHSMVALSVAAASAAHGIQLRFTRELDADSTQDAASTATVTEGRCA